MPEDVKKPYPVQLEDGGEITNEEVVELDGSKFRIAPGLDGKIYAFIQMNAPGDEPKWRGIGVDPTFALGIAALVSEVAMAMVYTQGDKRMSH